MTFSTFTQAGSAASIRVENSSICALIGKVDEAGAAQTEVVLRETVANVFVASTVAATLALISAPVPTSVLFVNADDALPVRLFRGCIDQIVPDGAANSQVTLLDGTVVRVVGTPTAVAAAMTPTSFNAGDIIGSAVFNADGTITAGSANNITAGAHTTGNYAGTLTAGTCTRFGVHVTHFGDGNYTPLSLFQGAQSSTSAFTVNSNLAADGTTRSDSSFNVVLVCITP